MGSRGTRATRCRHRRKEVEGEEMDEGEAQAPHPTLHAPAPSTGHCPPPCPLRHHPRALHPAAGPALLRIGPLLPLCGPHHHILRCGLACIRNCIVLRILLYHLFDFVQLWLLELARLQEQVSVHVLYLFHVLVHHSVLRYCC